MTTQAEIGVMWPQAKECQWPQQLEEARRDCPLETLGRGWPCQHLGFGLQNCEGTHFSCLSHTDYGNLLWQHLVQYYTIEALNCGAGEDP